MVFRDIVRVEEHDRILVGVADVAADDEVAVAVAAAARGNLLEFLLPGGLI
jgi:hypothetical protein